MENELPPDPGPASQAVPEPLPSAQPEPTIVAPVASKTCGMEPDVRMVKGRPVWNWPMPENIQLLARCPSR